MLNEQLSVEGKFDKRFKETFAPAIIAAGRKDTAT
jgi:hypothetical protein